MLKEVVKALVIEISDETLEKTRRSFTKKLRRKLKIWCWSKNLSWNKDIRYLWGWVRKIFLSYKLATFCNNHRFSKRWSKTTTVLFWKIFIIITNKIIKRKLKIDEFSICFHFSAKIDLLRW
jgi:hypothetical protein